MQGSSGLPAFLVETLGDFSTWSYYCEASTVSARLADTLGKVCQGRAFPEGLYMLQVIHHAGIHLRRDTFCCQ